MSRHDDIFEGMRFIIADLVERDRREAIRQQFEGPFWVRAVQALGSTMFTMVFWVLIIEVGPWAIRGVKVPEALLLVIAIFTAAGFLIRGYLKDRANRLGGTYDGHFRILE